MLHTYAVISVGLTNVEVRRRTLEDALSLCPVSALVALVAKDRTSFHTEPKGDRWVDRFN